MKPSNRYVNVLGANSCGICICWEMRKSLGCMNLFRVEEVFLFVYLSELSENIYDILRSG